MMPAINELMLAVSSSLAASIVVKATVILVLGLGASWLARRSRAAVRHALLAAAFAVLLILPVASMLAPPISIALSAAPQKPMTPAYAAAGASLPVTPTRASTSAASAVPPSAAFSLSTLLLAGWLAGTALFLLPVIMGLWQVRVLRRSALPWTHMQPPIERLALAAGIHRQIAVLLHESLPGPMTCGVIHPAIVLPQDAQTWNEEDLNRALVHELEHVRRADWVSHCLARAVCAVYWFHPLVWIAWRQLALYAERSCDDAVLGRSEATAYADQLVALAQRLSTKSPVLAMANRADLAMRVGAVLDSRQRRGRAGTFTVSLACAAALMLILTMSPLKMAAAPQTAGTDMRLGPIAQLHVETTLAIETVTVADRNGKPIEGLNASDFLLTEDGVPQKISIFEYQKLTAPGNSVSSYYILGYYTTNQNADGQFRKIQIVFTQDPTAKWNYRTGYYANKRFGSPNESDIVLGADRGVNSGITPPTLLSKIEPEYSDQARKAKYQGTVNLIVEVTPTGQVSSLKVIRSLGLGLDEKAFEAVKQWRFRPGRKDGQPVTTQVEVQVDFRLL